VVLAGIGGWLNNVPIARGLKEDCFGVPKREGVPSCHGPSAAILLSELSRTTHIQESGSHRRAAHIGPVHEYQPCR
jgi:hypothetical protein